MALKHLPEDGQTQEGARGWKQWQKAACPSSDISPVPI